MGSIVGSWVFGSIVLIVGCLEGVAVCYRVERVGVAIGSIVGSIVGSAVGSRVGCDGNEVGSMVGSIISCWVLWRMSRIKGCGFMVGFFVDEMH